MNYNLRNNYKNCITTYKILIKGTIEKKSVDSVKSYRQNIKFSKLYLDNISIIFI